MPKTNVILLPFPTPPPLIFRLTSGTLSGTMASKQLLLLVALSCATAWAHGNTFHQIPVGNQFSVHQTMSMSEHGNGHHFWRVDYPFQNTSLPWDARVDDLVSRLTLQEIMVQMARGGAGEYTTPSPAIPRLGRVSYI